MIERYSTAILPTKITEAPATAPEPTEFNAAVREAKDILERAGKDQFRLGELADKLDPIYGDGTLKRFAKAIGIDAYTLERYRSVYRAWKELIPAPGLELSYSVLRELANHPDRAQIIRDHPKLTKRQSRKYANAHRVKIMLAKSEPTDDEVWRTFQSDLLIIATKTLLRVGGPIPTPPPEVGVDPQVLQAAQAMAEFWLTRARELEELHRGNREPGCKAA